MLALIRTGDPGPALWKVPDWNSCPLKDKLALAVSVLGAESIGGIALANWVNSVCTLAASTRRGDGIARSSSSTSTDCTLKAGLAPVKRLKNPASAMGIEEPRLSCDGSRLKGPNLGARLCRTFSWSTAALASWRGSSDESRCKSGLELMSTISR